MKEYAVNRIFNTIHKLDQEIESATEITAAIRFKMKRILVWTKRFRIMMENELAFEGLQIAKMCRRVR